MKGFLKSMLVLSVFRNPRFRHSRIREGSTMAPRRASSIGPTNSWTWGKRREGIARTGLKGILALVAIIASLVVGSILSWVVYAANPTWTQLSPSGSLPDGRANDTAVWDTADNQLLVFGGNNGSVISFGDLWAYRPASNSWTQLSPSGSPPAARAAQGAIWDAADAQMLVFAGTDRMGTTFNDLFAYRPASNSWTQLSPSGSLPPARISCTAVWDAADAQMLIFGGRGADNSGLIFNDLFAYRPASNSWTQLSPSGSPPSPRYYQAAVWDAADAQMLIFGGTGGTNLYFNDLFAYRPASNSWTQLSPSGSPPSPGRYGPTAAWDAADSQMLVFGGNNVSTDYNDLFAYRPASNSWTQLSPSGSPPSPRHGPTSVWDAADSQMLVFGGVNADGSVYYNDLWSFRNATLPPTITITTPTSGATYLLNQSVAASYACTPGSASIATCAGPVASGAPIDTGSVGTKTFTVQASDSSGNTASQSVTYTVGYNLCVLYDQTKAVHSGATIPIKLELCDANGADVSASTIVMTAVSVTQVSNNAPGTLESPGNANPDNNFRFDTTLGTAGGYIFNLSTEGFGTGTYAVNFTAGSDPTLHAVQFEVK